MTPSASGLESASTSVGSRVDAPIRRSAVADV
jgi:hypothetical protein